MSLLKTLLFISCKTHSNHKRMTTNAHSNHKRMTTNAITRSNRMTESAYWIGVNKFNKSSTSQTTFCVDYSCCSNASWTKPNFPSGTDVCVQLTDAGTWKDASCTFIYPGVPYICKSPDGGQAQFYFKPINNKLYSHSKLRNY